VAIHYRENRGAAQSVLASLAGSGHAIHCSDLAEAGGTESLWRAVTDTHGRVDILVNNAGIYVEHPPIGVDSSAWHDAWQRTLQLNLLAPALLCHAAVNAMSAAELVGHGSEFGRGRIVNISSRGAFLGEPRGPAYGASKAGLNSLSQSLAKAAASRGVYVYCIAPGWVETDMAAEHLIGPAGQEVLAQHPLGRVTQPDEVARAVAFCALDAPAAMTGAILDVNGASYLRT
jgi:NAD(P)-dependent dehydrogenase (short-subunit alcohol dehydrogenase family)